MASAKSRAIAPLLLGLAASLWVQTYAYAQRVPPPPETRPDKPDTRPPIPPGVPTTPENVQEPTEGEVKAGRDAATQVEKHYKVLTSGPMNDRLQRIARVVVDAIERPEIAEEYKRVYRLTGRGDKSRRVPFEFNFKLVDTSKEINAFSLAGGPVYVTRGLMDYTASDDELASVLAHECAHVAFHHVQQLTKKEKKANAAQIWGLLATVLAGAAGGGQAAAAASNLLVTSQLVSIATLTGYGRELETEADRIGVMALRGTKYNPLGMMTFMQKLSRDERLRGNPDGGIFQSHPYSSERVAACKHELEQFGIATDSAAQRKVGGVFRVQVVPTRFNGKDATDIKLNDGLVFTVVAGEGTASAQERAERIAKQMETMFIENLTFNDVKQSADKSTVFFRGQPLIKVYPEDAAVMGGSAESVTERAYKEVIKALWREKLDM